MNTQFIKLAGAMMAFLCLGCTKAADGSIVCPAVEVSAVATAPADTNRTVTLNDGSRISLTHTPLVTIADITHARASLEGGHWVLDVDITDAAAARNQAYTGSHVGQSIALLVDGKVTGTPRIAGPVTAKRFQIGDFTKAEAERLAAGISQGCKR